MKSTLTIFLLFLITETALPQQFEIRGGMGIDFVSTPSLTDYINIFIQPANLLGDFNSAVVFSAEGGVLLSDNYQMGVELAYLLNSFTDNRITGQYDLSYGIIMPSLMSYYVIGGEGYNFKFGGGAGLRIVSADESLPATGTTINYSSTGIGLILRAIGNTSLGGNLFASIVADIRYDINGEPKNGDNFLGGSTNIRPTNFNSFSAGIKLGLSYIF